MSWSARCGGARSGQSRGRRTGSGAWPLDTDSAVDLLERVLRFAVYGIVFPVCYLLDEERHPDKSWVLSQMGRSAELGPCTHGSSRPTDTRAAVRHDCPPVPASGPPTCPRNR